MVKITKRCWQYLWKYQPPPNALGKQDEGHGERASLKNNTYGSSSSISDKKEEPSNLAGDQGTDVKLSTDQIVMIPTRFIGVSFCLKGVS